MSRLVEFLYPLPDLRRTTWSLLRWWESRRPAYNVIVGTTGLVTLGLVRLLFWLPPDAPGQMPGLGLVLLYGLIANVAYTGGWLTEVALQRLWGDEAPRAGPALLRVGVSVSVGITLFPAALAGLDWLFRLARHFFG